MSLFKLATSALALSAVCVTTAAARDQVQIAGSSTVLPYASIVAEAFGENFDFPTPVVESGGSSSGLKRFCEGVGENTIDVANASRAIREKEIKACAEAGVTDIIEVRIGYDGIVFASQIDGPAYTAFQPADIFNALGAKYRGKPAGNRAALIAAVLMVQDYVVAQAGRVAEIEINPLILTPTRAVVADALIREKQ